MIADGSRYSYFRACPGDRSVFIRNGAPAELTLDDIEALNARCDDREKPRNRQVKKNVVHSLTRYFGEAAFHIYEFGCGRFPLSKYFGSRSGISYHGIERDRNHIAELHQMNIPASGWDVAMKNPVPTDKPSVCTAVYALHFMVNSKLPKRIRTLTNEQGFFVGNFYIDPNEAQSFSARRKLGDILDRNDMSFITIDDPGSRANNYWVIGSSGDVTNIHRYAAVLNETLKSGKAAPAPGLR